MCVLKPLPIHVRKYTGSINRGEAVPRLSNVDLVATLQYDTKNLVVVITLALCCDVIVIRFLHGQATKLIHMR